MLIDINTWIGHWPFKQLKYNRCSTLLERMDTYGVDLSIVSNLNGVFYKNTQQANEELFEEIRTERRFKERFIPFAIINPIYAGWKDDLNRSIHELGMQGIRLFPLYHDYEPTDPACIELVSMARELGVPVALTTRIVDRRQRSWMDIDREWDLRDVIPVIREVPDAKYMILNIANSMRLDDEDTELIRQADLLMDTSGRSMNTLPELIRTYGGEKFAFGTHAPILDYLTGMLRIESLREQEADETVKEQIRSGNAKKMMGI